jgi:hypothetical protein
MTNDYRIGTTFTDYTQERQKKLDVADRRPGLSRASDLVGPGIAALAVRITDFNDLLATYNGYFSAAVGAPGAPNNTHAFIGFTVSDAELGGLQNFTSLTSGAIFQRTFSRNPLDAQVLYWSNWKTVSA